MTSSGASTANRSYQNILSLWVFRKIYAISSEQNIVLYGVKFVSDKRFNPELILIDKLSVGKEKQTNASAALPAGLPSEEKPTRIQIIFNVLYDLRLFFSLTSTLALPFGLKPPSPLRFRGFSFAPIGCTICTNCTKDHQTGERK